MTYLNPDELLQNQDTWKRTQLRMPHTLYEAINSYANENNMSLNTAFISLADKGLTHEKPSPTDDFNIFMRGLESLTFGMESDNTSNYLVDLVKAWKEKNNKPT